MAFDESRSRAVLFGGTVGPAGSATLSAETWLLAGTTWTQVKPATSPSPRRGFGIAYDAVHNEVILFGGATADDTRLADTWVWNGLTWTQKQPASAPPARADHAMAWDPVRKQVVLFGGSDPTALSDTWVWDGNDWTKQNSSVSPPARWGASMAWDPAKQVVLLYGGAGGRTDTWAWNGSAWTDVSPVAGNPGVLDGPVMVTHGSNVILTGGSAKYWQTWLWNGYAWQTLLTNTPAPAVLGIAGVYDTVRNRTVVFSPGANNTAAATISTLDLGSGCTFGGVVAPILKSADVNSGNASVSVNAQPNCSWAVKSTPAVVAGLPSSGVGSGTANLYWPPVDGFADRIITSFIGGTPILIVTQAGLTCPAPGPLPASHVDVVNSCTATYTYEAKAQEQIAFRGVASGVRPQYPVVSVTGPAPSTSSVTGSAPLMPNAVTLLPASGVFTFPSAGTYTVVFQAAGASPTSSTFDWVKTGDACSTTTMFYSPAGSYSASEQSAYTNGSSYLLGVSLPPGCQPVAVTTSASWIRTSSSSVSPGYSAFDVTVDPNYGDERTATLTVGNSTISFRQYKSSCSYSLSSTAAAVDAGRNASSTTLSTTSGCPWTATSDSAWAQVYPLRGAGTSAVEYTVFPNFGTKPRTATISIAGRNFVIAQAAGQGTATDRFIRLLYFNFFGRVPTDAEVAFHAASGLSRAQLASNFFHSAEANAGARFVAGLYVGLLDRDAEYGGWQFQRDALANGRINPSLAVSNFIDSQEFALHNGALALAPYVSLLYRQILNRQPSADEQNFQVQALMAGLSRAELAKNFLNSAEFQLFSGPRITAFLAYAGLLQRQPSPAETAATMAVAAQAQGQPTVAAIQDWIRDKLLDSLVNGAEVAKLLE